jgi:hypothetical protein
MSGRGPIGETLQTNPVLGQSSQLKGAILVETSEIGLSDAIEWSIFEFST